MMRFDWPAQAMNLIKLISSLSKHHSDPSCPIIHGNGIITARRAGPDAQPRDTGPQNPGLRLRRRRRLPARPPGLLILNTD